MIRTFAFASVLLSGCSSSDSVPEGPADSALADSALADSALADTLVADSTTDSGSPGDSSIDSSAETAVDAGADSKVDAPSDTGCIKCVSAEISWGSSGGFVPFVDRSTLKPCNDYQRTRTGTSMLTCNDVVPSCVADAGGKTDVTEVELALADPDVKAAIAAAPVLYGRDDRPVDGSVFQIVIGGKQIELGGTCSGGSCTPVPAGLAALRTLLQKIDTDKNSTSCADFIK